MVKANEEDKPISGDGRRSSIVLYNNTRFVVSLASDLESITIKAVQKFLDKNAIKDIFRWDISQDLAEVKVFAEFRDGEQFLPQVVVSNVLATERSVSFGQQLSEFDYEDKHYLRFGGHVSFDITILVVGADAPTRNELGDLLFLGLMYPLRVYLQNKGIIIETNSLRMLNREVAQLTNNKIVHTLNIGFRCYCEWAQDFVMDSYDLDRIVVNPSY